MTLPAVPLEPALGEGTILGTISSALLSGMGPNGITNLLGRLPGVSPRVLATLRTTRWGRHLFVLQNAGMLAPGPLSAMVRQNSMRRAAYLAAAARRLTIDHGPESLVREERYSREHLGATNNRAAAARKVANASGEFGSRLLGWYAVLDDRTSPECRLAHGRNFNPGQIPPIGYPGAVHPRCRCHPGRAHPSSRRVEQIRPERRRVA
jgi:hypothetical protein